MSSRKRRSNRLTVEQLEANRDLRESELNQAVVLIGFAQEHLELAACLYRSVALRIALQMVREGDAERIHVDTDNGPIVMFRELKPIAGAQYCLPMMPNAAAAEALAEHSSGQRLSGARMRRVSNVLMFPFVGDAKAPLTGPRVSEMDRARARKLCGFRPATAGHCYRPTRVERYQLATAA